MSTNERGAGRMPSGSRQRRVARAGAILVVLTALIVGLSAGLVGAQEPEDDAARLAEFYTPIIMIKAQDAPCDAEGEPYAPTSVEIVLDNPEVLLRQVGSGNPVVQRAPSAADLFELGEGFFLDFPGSSLEPGCIYERDFDRYSRDVPPTVYAHIVQSDDHPDLLALQYWFYWYYNDWNNKHESDWEGIQLLFEASSVAEALQTEPSSVGYAQHEGGERVDWDSARLERSGSHPVVYSSAGSHASYLGSAVYLGRSASEGFGCDTTSEPSVRLEPEVVVLPDAVDDPSDPLAWLSYEGRWGERQSGAFNGPTGPAAKSRWLDPIAWHDELRTSSVVVPGGEGGAASVVNVFCGVVESGSRTLITFAVSPLRVFVALGIVVLLAKWLIGRTDWSPVPATPLRRRRTAGQIFRASGAIVRKRWPVLAAFGVVYIPTAALVGLLAGLVSILPLVGDVVGLANNSGGTNLVFAVFVGGLPHLVALVTVNALVAVFLNDEVADDRSSRRQAVRQVWERRRQLASGLIQASIVVVALMVSIVGIPFAIRQLIRYQFVAQAVMLDDLDGRRALDRSSDLVRGRWWHTAAVIGAINLVVAAIALITALLLLVFVTGIPMWLFSGLVSLIYALIVPPAAIAQTLLYGDAVAASETDGVEPVDPVDDLVPA